MEEEIKKIIEQKELEIQKLLNEVNELKKQYIIKPSEMTLEEKLNIYIDYFKGRDDVYPYLSVDKKDPNKKYYIPACINEWKKGVCNKTMGKPCKTCQYRENKPLTIETIKNHIYGNKTIGIYPMLEDETCYFLVFDFDDKKLENHIKEDVLAFASVCDNYNVPIAIERSRSGKGIHIWLFFKDRVKAKTVRKLGSLLLSKTMEIRDNLNIESFDRMFPNQDNLPSGGYGNLIALPLQTEPIKYGNSLFIDRNFIPIKGQFSYLKRVKKLAEKDVFDKIEILSKDTVDVTHQDFEIKEEVKNKINLKFPKSIKVIREDMIYIDKAGLSAAVKNRFRRLATFANPEFYKKQQMRMSVYNTPMVIDCSKENDKYLMLPRGTYENLFNLCKENNIKMNITDKRNKGNELKINFKGTLRKEQNLALNKMLEHDTGILYAPTGFGKTVICCKMIAERKVNTLIITHTLSLLNQWQDRLKQFLGIDEIGQISSKKKVITSVIDIASVKTIWNSGNFNNFVKKYGMVIMDECHHSSAYTYESAMNTIPSKYFYGVTATPERENGHTPIIKMQCGDIRYSVDFKKFNKDLNLPMKVYVKNVHLSFVNKNITDYSLNEINDLIAKDILRNNKIVDDITKEFKDGKNVLVLTERLSHLKYFEEKLSLITSNLFVYQGGLGKKALEKYKKLQNDMTNKIIIATGSYIGEGFDDPSLDVLFLTMPISGETRVTQYTGRLHRKSENKKSIIVYDYVDDNFFKTRNMFEKRKKTYKKLGYEIVEDKKN